MGSALHIPLPESVKTGSSVSTKITYKTTAECTALQWLDKEHVIDLILSGKMLTQGTVRLKGDNFHIFSVNANPSMPVQLPLFKVKFSLFKIIFTSSIVIFSLFQILLRPKLCSSLSYWPLSVG
jgi:hypothetical protein